MPDELKKFVRERIAEILKTLPAEEHLVNVIRGAAAGEYPARPPHRSRPTAARYEMNIRHVNRRGDTYYLHEGQTKTGKAHFFSRKKDGTLAEAVPAGYEIYESPNAQVFLRKAEPRIVTDAEVSTVERAVRDLAKLAYFLIEVKGSSIIVHTPNQEVSSQEELATPSLRQNPAELRRRIQSRLTYSPMMRFTLVNEKGRRFSVERWCFRSSIDGWLPLSSGGNLEKLVARYCPHLGRESFYELI